MAKDKTAFQSASSLVSDDEVNPLGGASNEDLLAVVTKNLGADPDLEASEVVIAVESLARVVEARMAHSDWKKDQKRLAVFMVSDRARELAAALSAIKRPIIDDGSQELTGRLWLTGPSFASGHFLPFASEDPGQMFEEIKAKGLGARAALVFNPTATDAEIRYYPNGVDEDEKIQRFSISNQTFSLAALDEAMKQFHEQNIITPDVILSDFNNPWKDPPKYIPRKNAEAFFQSMLQLVFGVKFGSKYRVAFELRGTEGRCDLMVMSRRSANEWTFNVVLELKVLRSFTSGGSSVSSTVRSEAISGGLLQAIAYKKENAAKNGLLCCYDMRSPKHYDGSICLEPIKSRAKKSKIGLRHFRIYGSSKDLREDKYAESSPTA